MQYLHMRPAEIQDAVKRNVPVVMVAGAVEYHGPHLPIGTDFLIPENIIRQVEQRCECIVMPPLPFSSTMFWAAGPESGEFDFDPDALLVYAREILRGLVKIGFRRIYIVQHHQGENGVPALTLKRAAAEVTREVGKTFGLSWGWKSEEELPFRGVFGMIRVAYLDSFSTYPAEDPGQIPIGHAGKGETQLMMSGYPETVKMDELVNLKKEHGSLPEWLQDSHEGTRAEGDRWVEFCVRGWVKELG